MKDKVSYLGHIVCKEGISPDESKVKDVQNFTPPRTLKQLQKLIGYINWYREFIPNISKKLLPITEKVKKNTKISWSCKDQALVESIFAEIKQTTLLNYPEYAKPFYLEVDASKDAIGAILYQEKNLLGYFSQKLSNSQLNYTVYEKEFYSIYRALNHFKRIIFDSKV